MNSDERILQILENSACLSKGQLLGYLRHTLYPEELRAVELHLSTCALCSDALEGLEGQQEIEKLLAEMTPPALPAIQPREKPKEKKDTHTAHEEKAAALPHKAHTAAHTHTGNESSTAFAFRPRRRWARPIGIAAALLLAFGALWYFEFNKKEDKPGNLAMQNEQTTAPAASAPVVTDSENRPGMAATPAIPKKDTALLIAERKHRDSLLLAKREAEKLRLKDSAQAGLLAKKAAKTGPVGDAQPVAVRSEAAQAKESTAVAADETAQKVAMAAPAAASRSKSDSKENARAPTDFELGLQKYKEKNYASALLYFRSAESNKSDPRHWEAVYYSALCNKNLDKKRKAVKLFERVIEANAPQKKAAQKQLDELKNN